MVTRKLLLKIILFCWTIAVVSLGTVYAQEPDEEEEIIIPPSGQIKLTFEQLGYETKELNEDLDRVTGYYRIDLPGNFQISPTGNYLDLVTSHFPETPDKPSLLEVKVNGEFVSFVPLTAENAISGTVPIELDKEVLQAGSNLIAISLDTGGICQDPAGFLRVLLDKDSALNFGYEQNPYLTDLALYPFPFRERSLLNIPVTIVLPNQPTSDELSAAAIIAAGLGKPSGWGIDLTAVLVDDLTPDIQNNNHLIVIGQPDTNDLLSNLTLPLSIDRVGLKPGQGILQEIVSPWNEFRLVLVVSGLDGAGLVKASYALNRQAHFLGMRGPVAVVIELNSPSESDILDTFNLTLASLGYGDAIIYGTSPQEHTFEFILPFGWQLEEAPYFVLKFTHADIVSPNSVINVELNSVPVASTLLDDSNAAQGELLIPLPYHLLKSGINQLLVSTEMELLDVDECTALTDERAWTVLSSMSEIFLPYDTINLSPDLSLFPYPFSVGQTALILPDQSSPQIFNELIQLAVRIGTASRAREDISIQVNYALEIDPTIRQDHHLILLGSPTENPLVAEINSSLPQPFVAGSNILEPLVVDNVAFLSDPNRDAGLLEIIESPWNEEYSVLAITGTTAEGIEVAAQTLLERTQQLEGNLAVVEPSYDPFSDEAPQLSTYSVDTRQLEASVNQETSDTNRPISEKDLFSLANRWWK